MFLDFGSSSVVLQISKPTNWLVCFSLAEFLLMSHDIFSNNFAVLLVNDILLLLSSFFLSWRPLPMLIMVDEFHCIHISSDCSICLKQSFSKIAITSPPCFKNSFCIICGFSLLLLRNKLKAVFNLLSCIGIFGFCFLSSWTIGFRKMVMSVLSVIADSIVVYNLWFHLHWIIWLRHHF